MHIAALFSCPELAARDFAIRFTSNESCSCSVLSPPTRRATSGADRAQSTVPTRPAVAHFRPTSANRHLSVSNAPPRAISSTSAWRLASCRCTKLPATCVNGSPSKSRKSAAGRRGDLPSRVNRAASTGSACMFPQSGVSSSIDLASSGAAQPRTKRPAADRPPRGTTKAGEKQDRRRLPTPSPNSRQSRAPRKSASSHPQDRARVMEGTPVSVRLEVFVGIDVSKHSWDVCILPAMIRLYLALRVRLAYDSAPPNQRAHSRCPD